MVTENQIRILIAASKWEVSSANRVRKRGENWVLGPTKEGELVTITVNSLLKKGLGTRFQLPTTRKTYLRPTRDGYMELRKYTEKNGKKS